MLGALGVFASLAHAGHLFASTPDAIAHARLHVARVPHAGGGQRVSASTRVSWR